MAKKATFSNRANLVMADLAGLVAASEEKKATVSDKEKAEKRAQRALGQLQCLRERKFYNSVKVKDEDGNKTGEEKLVTVNLKPVNMVRDKAAIEDAKAKAEAEGLDPDEVADIVKHANNCALQRVIRLVSSPYNMTAAEVRESTIHTDGVCAPDWIVAELSKLVAKDRLQGMFAVICENVPEATRDELFPTLFGAETVTASDVETVQAEQLQASA